MISRSMPESERVSTFWHELAHAMKWELDITHSTMLDEEAIANLLALGLTPLSDGMITEGIKFIKKCNGRVTVCVRNDLKRTKSTVAILWP